MNQEILSKDKIDPVLVNLFDIPSGDDKPHLVASKCKKCSNYFFPKKPLCPDCFEEGLLEDVFLSEEGVIYTYCIVRAAPVGFDSPYVLGYIDLPEGIRIFSMIESDDLADIKIGAKVKYTTGKIRQDENGEDVYGFKFSVI
ncbi:MAG: Zn-ribbon domain-containing OB-fold protein [Spirochaetota bacterium]|nr:Zn-ribbon domain-containing OB-fold protein [Spirochaetota bacterium]